MKEIEARASIQTVTWARLPQFIAVCCFLVSIPGITIFQYQCKVHSVFSYGHLYVYDFSPLTQEQRPNRENYTICSAPNDDSFNIVASRFSPYHPT